MTPKNKPSSPGQDLQTLLERRYRRVLNAEENREIRANLFGFFDLLREWAADDARNAIRPTLSSKRQSQIERAKERT